jgi:hypothetical protein
MVSCAEFWAQARIGEIHLINPNAHRLGKEEV